MAIQQDFEQYSDEWWNARLGKPSASNAKKLITSTGAPSKQLNDYAIELAYNRYANKTLDSWGGNEATERGTIMEEEARDYYQLVTGEEVTEVGMFTDDENRWLASPDGVVDGKGILEIKCQLAKGHTKSLMYYAKNKKPPTDFVPQIQMQMYVSGLEWADLLLYHDELPKLKIRIDRDEKFITTLSAQLIKVCDERDRILKTLNEYK